MLERLGHKADEAGVDNVEIAAAGFLTYDHRGDPADIVYSRYALHHLPDFWKVVALRRVRAMPEQAPNGVPECVARGPGRRAGRSAPPRRGAVVRGLRDAVRRGGVPGVWALVPTVRVPAMALLVELASGASPSQRPSRPCTGSETTKAP